MAEAETKAAKTSILVKMNDGREVEFGEKTKIKKDYGVLPNGNVFAQIDFVDGQTIAVEVEPGSPLGLQAMGHGLVQKLGDASAGAENLEDAFESILEVAARINAGDWNKAREGGGGAAKGSSELVLALVKVLDKDKETVRGLLANLSAGEKAALRKTPDVAAAIEQVKAERKPSKAEQEKLDAANSLLAGLKAGVVPEAAPVE